MSKDTSRPIIGINTDYRHIGRGNRAHSFVHSGYFDCIEAAGGLPVILPPLTREEDLQELLERVDGLVLGGGEDLDPKHLNQNHHPSVRPIPERRERADRMACKLARRMKLPLLGIGLGMQEMNVFFGGTLYTHVPEELPRAIPHRDPHGGCHRHVVHAKRDSLILDIYGPDEMRVSSYHHQGIRRIAPDFRIGATAPDGLIEAIEHDDIADWWAVGVQWHPELEGTISLDTQLLKAFIEASKDTAFRRADQPTLAIAS